MFMTITYWFVHMSQRSDYVCACAWHRGQIVSVCTCAWHRGQIVSVCAHVHDTEVRRQLPGVSSLFPPRGSWAWTLIFSLVSKCLHLLGHCWGQCLSFVYANEELVLLTQERHYYLTDCHLDHPWEIFNVKHRKNESTERITASGCSSHSCFWDNLQKQRGF